MAQVPIQAPQENGDSSSEHLEVEGVTEGGWIQWFCSLEGNDFFVEVEEEFIRDPFNLYGLKHKFDHERYKYLSHKPLRDCMELIVSPYAPTEHDLQDEGHVLLFTL